MGVLISKPGLTSASTLSIPTTWNPQWFRNLIANQLTGADVRNAVGSGGITVSGNLTSPYATIGFSPPIALPGPVTISSAPSGETTLTVNASNSANSTIDIVDAGNNPWAMRIIRSDLSNNAVGLFETNNRALFIGAASGTFEGLVLSGGLVLNGSGASTVPSQVTGFGTPTGAAVIANFPGSTATLVQTSETVAEILTILKGIGLIGA